MPKQTVTAEHKKAKARARHHKRIAALEAAAMRDGFSGVSEAMTAWMKGEYALIRVAPVYHGESVEIERMKHG